uniref:Secreted protein n=1 Tax=Syphacia muris TaxID=451379 RepID=A0A0N5AMY2_9BILA
MKQRVKYSYVFGFCALFYCCLAREVASDVRDGRSAAEVSARTLASDARRERANSKQHKTNRSLHPRLQMCLSPKAIQQLSLGLSTTTYYGYGQRRYAA